MKKTTIKLPEFPMATAEGNRIFVTYRDGHIMVWGEEDSHEDAAKVAQELELELRAIEYVKWHVTNFIKDMKAQLKELGLPEDHLESILVEGHKAAGKYLRPRAQQRVAEEVNRR